jgi:hypothetical protein
LPGSSPESGQAVNTYLTTRATTPADAGELVRCAREVLHANWTPNFVAWKYFGNPAGRVYGRYAELDGHPAGFYGNIPVLMTWGGQIMPGAQAVDAMVDPYARRHGVFVRLAQETFAEMDQAGVRLAYVFPSPAAQAAFVGRLGWTPVGAVPRYVQILRASRAAMAHAKRWPQTAVMWACGAAAQALARIERARLRAELRARSYDDTDLRVTEIQSREQAFDARFDDLWAAAAPKAIAVVRDAAYLTWRYAQQPLGGYTTITVERGRNLAGFVVLSPRDVVAHGALAIAEWLVMPGDAPAAHVLLAASRRVALALGCTQLQCWLLPQHDLYLQALRLAGFIYWPQRFVPGALRYTTPFVIRPQPGSALQLDPAQLANWYLTMGDHDYY